MPAGALALMLVLAVLPTPAIGAAEHAPAFDRWTEQAMRELTDEARTDDLAPALITLRVRTRPEAELDHRGIAAQRHRASDAQTVLLSELADVEHRVTHRFDSLPVIAMELSEPAVARLQDSRVVASVSVDHPLVPLLDVSVPRVEADLAHDAGVRGTGTAIAILDTGVDAEHEAFGDRVVTEACFSRNSAKAASLCPNGRDTQVGPGAATPCTHVVGCEHGTHVAGIAAGAGPVITGMAPAAQVIAIQIFHEQTGDGCSSADGCISTTSSDLLRGLEHVYALRDTYDIAAVNMSLGGRTFDRTCDDTIPQLTQMFSDLRAAGIAPVAAAGNNGATAAISEPACITSVISVGATQVRDAFGRSQPDGMASFSNAHPDLLDLLAPGTPIRSAVTGGEYAFLGGTSMAAPHVAGAWALLREDDPTASVDGLLAELTSSGVPLVDDREGASGASYPRISLDPTGWSSPDDERPIDEEQPADDPRSPDPEGCRQAPFGDVPIDHPFCEEIARSVAAGITSGFPDGTFRPSRVVTRQAVAAFLYRAAGEPEGPFDDPGFSDVDDDHPFRDPIAWAVDQDVVRGYGDGTFRPSREVTRQAAASFLHGTVGRPMTTPCESGFTDVAGDHGFCQAIAWAAATGVSNGFGDGTFRPTAPVTRQAMVAFVDGLLS